MRHFRVKTIAALLVIVLGPMASISAQAEPVEGYPQFMVTNALLWLHFCLKATESPFEKTPPIVTEMERAALEIQRLSFHQSVTQNSQGLVEAQYELLPNSLVQFARESSGKFRIPGRRDVRDAVTGDAIDSPIIFNLDRTSDPAQFTYEKALRLWVHEIGHKINLPISPAEKQAAVDELAGKVGRYFGWQASLNKSLLLFNGAPHNRPDELVFTPMDGYFPSRAPNRLAVIARGKIYDLSSAFNGPLDEKFRSGRENYHDTHRVIEDVRWLHSSDPNLSRGLFEMSTYRRPINDKQYFLTDMGGPYRYEIEFSLDLKQDPPHLEIVSSHAVPERLTRAKDARVEISKFTVGSDGQFEGEVNLAVRTEVNFHSGSFPTHRHMQLILYQNGETLYLPVTVDAYSDRGWWSLPGEIFKQEVPKRGHLSGQLPADWPHEFQILGVVDQFFRLGRFADSQTHRMIVNMDEPLLVSPMPCENLLTP